MSLSLLLLCLSVIGAFAFVLGRVRAAALSGGRSSAMHSRLSYHGAYAAIWAMLPALTLVCVWLIASPIVIDRLVTKSFPEEVQALPPAELNLSYGMVRSIAHGMRMLDGRELADVAGVVLNDHSRVQILRDVLEAIQRRQRCLAFGGKARQVRVGLVRSIALAAPQDEKIHHPVAQGLTA